MARHAVRQTDRRMPGVLSGKSYKPRELRRRVILPARMRTPAGWSDACILNVSSRGLLVHSVRVPEAGSTVELRHLDCAIVARVVWRDGAKAGLQAEAPIAVNEILSLSQSETLSLNTPGDRFVDRRARPRTHEDNRIRARSAEFVSIAFIGIWLAGGLFVLVQEAFATPMAYVEAALSADSR